MQARTNLLSRENRQSTGIRYAPGGGENKQIELKTAGNVELNQPAHVIALQQGLAIWSQSHHFVFVPVMGNPEINVSA